MFGDEEMNKIKMGRDFEIEAFKILREKFDVVEWLSEKTKSSFDFKCIKEGKVYYGDAKLVNFSKRPSLNHTQKDADFVIAKIKGKVKYFNKSEVAKFSINYNLTINVSEETWKELISRKNPGESFDSVIKKALLEVPTKKGEKKQ
jgi:hypothetical protein